MPQLNTLDGGPSGSMKICTQSSGSPWRGTDKCMKRTPEIWHNLQHVLVCLSWEHFFSFLFQDLPVLCFPLLRGEFVRLCVCWNQGDVATRMLSAHAVVGSSCGVFPAFVCLSFTPLQSLVSWLQVGFFFVNIDEVYLLIEESWQRNYDVWLQHWDARYQNTLRGLTINFWSRNFRPCLCTCVLLHYACD